MMQCWRVQKISEGRNPVRFIIAHIIGTKQRLNHTWRNKTMNALFSRHSVTFCVCFSATFQLAFRGKIISHFFNVIWSVVRKRFHFYYHSEISSNTSLPKSHFSHSIEITLTKAVSSLILRCTLISLIIRIIPGNTRFDVCQKYKKLRNRGG